MKKKGKYKKKYKILSTKHKSIGGRNNKKNNEKNKP